MTTTHNEAALAQLAKRRAALDEQIQQLTEQRDAVNAAILQLVPGPDSYAAGDLVVQVVQAHRLDTKAIAAKYPADEFPELYTRAVDTAAVKRHLAPVDLEAFQTPNKPSVKLA